MKKQILMILVLATIVFGCSTPAYVEKDTNLNLSNYKTYMWVDARASENDASSQGNGICRYWCSQFCECRIAKLGLERSNR